MAVYPDYKLKLAALAPAGNEDNNLGPSLSRTGAAFAAIVDLLLAIGDRRKARARDKRVAGRTSTLEIKEQAPLSACSLHTSISSYFLMYGFPGT